MVGCVQGSTAVWKVWDLEGVKVKTLLEVLFDEERNAYAPCPLAKEIEEAREEQEEEDSFGLKTQEPRHSNTLKNPRKHIPRKIKIR